MSWVSCLFYAWMFSVSVKCINKQANLKKNSLNVTTKKKSKKFWIIGSKIKRNDVWLKTFLRYWRRIQFSQIKVTGAANLLCPWTQLSYFGSDVCSCDSYLNNHAYNYVTSVLQGGDQNIWTYYLVSSLFSSYKTMGGWVFMWTACASVISTPLMLVL